MKLLNLVLNRYTALVIKLDRKVELTNISHNKKNNYISLGYYVFL